MFIRINRDTWSAIVQKRSAADVSGLAYHFTVLTEQMQHFVHKYTLAGKKIAVWGASHQAFTAISTTGVQTEISYIIDSAPFKQGRFAPASHLPIVAPSYFFEQPVDGILIIAPGYTDEIAGIISKEYGQGVEIAVLKSAGIEIFAKSEADVE